MLKKEVTIYTDGSCNTQHQLGAWVAILIADNEKTVLSGHAVNTTNNRMELTAVVEALKYLHNNYDPGTLITIVSDSQYVVGLADRRERLTSSDFNTKKNTHITNADLVKELFKQETGLTILFEKIKAHQKQGSIINYNIEADKLSRKMVRELVISYG